MLRFVIKFASAFDIIYNSPPPQPIFHMDSYYLLFYLIIRYTLYEYIQTIHISTVYIKTRNFNMYVLGLICIQYTHTGSFIMYRITGPSMYIMYMLDLIYCICSLEFMLLYNCIHYVTSTLVHDGTHWNGIYCMYRLKLP
jgi:hypothetical protein